VQSKSGKGQINFFSFCLLALLFSVLGVAGCDYKNCEDGLKISFDVSDTNYEGKFWDWDEDADVKPDVLGSLTLKTDGKVYYETVGQRKNLMSFSGHFFANKKIRLNPDATLSIQLSDYDKLSPNDLIGTLNNASGERIMSGLKFTHEKFDITVECW